jgi:hypothetical protein
MSLFGDLKRIFFGAKSVAKHQSERAREAARQKGEEWSEQARDRAERLEEDLEAAGRQAADKAKDSFQEFSKRVREEADYAAEKGQELKDKAEDWLGERLRKTAPPSADPAAQFSLSDDEPADPQEKDTVDFEAGLEDGPAEKQPKEPSAFAQASDEILNQAAKAGHEAKEKLKEASEKVGEQVLKKGGEWLDKAAATGAELKGKASEKLGDLAQRAKEAAERESLDDAIAKAKEAQEQAEARARAFDGQEEDRDTSGSTLSGTDSFFERAERFAQGDYHNEGGKKMRIQDDPDYQKEDKTGGTLHGFTDEDGDGDPLIDDAILDDDEDDQDKS